MSRFLPYSPDQAYLLPPSVKDELGEDPLSMFLHRVVEGLDLREFENAYSDEGGELYAASLMLKALRLCAGDDKCAGAGAAYPGGSGAALSAGWAAAG
jgi:hypothetical protein